MTTRTVAWSNASWASASVSGARRPCRHQRGEQVRFVRLAVGHFFEQKFHGLRTFSRSTLGQIGLALAGLLDGIEQPGDALLDRLEAIGRKQLPQAVQFLGAFAVIEPAVAFPLAPRLEIEARIDEPELMAVGEQAQGGGRCHAAVRGSGRTPCDPGLDRLEATCRP